MPLYDIRGASSRYRVYQYLAHLDRYHITPMVARVPLGSRIAKTVGLLRVLWLARQADVVFIQKRLFSHQTLSLIRRANDRITYDFDDAIYSASAPYEINATTIEKTSQRLAAMLQQAARVVAGNHYLAEYAREYSDSVTIIPTVIDTDRFAPKGQLRRQGIVLGWIGNPENLGYLESLESVFSELAARYRERVILRIVSSAPYSSRSGLMVDNRQWHIDTEIGDLRTFDLGLSPLRDDEWTRGKCGFRTLQYMAVGLPVVVSPVGVNREIVKDGVNGFLAQTDEEWFARVSQLIDGEQLRRRLGLRGRSTVERDYSLASALPKFVAVLKEVTDL